MRVSIKAKIYHKDDVAENWQGIEFYMDVDSDNPNIVKQWIVRRMHDQGSFVKSLELENVSQS